MRTIYLIKSGNYYKSFTDKISWSEDVNDADVFRSRKGAQSSLNIIKSFLERRLERANNYNSNLSGNLGVLIRELDEGYAKDYKMVLESEIVEANIVLVEKN